MNDVIGLVYNWVNRIELTLQWHERPLCSLSHDVLCNRLFIDTGDCVSHL